MGEFALDDELDADENPAENSSWPEPDADPASEPNLNPYPESNPASDPNIDDDPDADRDRGATVDGLCGGDKTGSDTHATSMGKKLDEEDNGDDGMGTPGAVIA